MQRKPKRHAESPDLNRTKFTPRTRPAHQAAHSGSLINANPDRKYVLVPIDEQHPMSYKYYESMGYEVEKAQKDGVRIQMGEKFEIGSPLKWQGNVLVSCSAERAKEIFENGADGLTGQNYQDKVMQRIRRNELEKRVAVQGASEETSFGELEQNTSVVFRE